MLELRDHVSKELVSWIFVEGGEVCCDKEVEIDDQGVCVFSGWKLRLEVGEEFYESFCVE